MIVLLTLDINLKRMYGLRTYQIIKLWSVFLISALLAACYPDYRLVSQTPANLVPVANFHFSTESIKKILISDDGALAIVAMKYQNLKVLELPGLKLKHNIQLKHGISDIQLIGSDQLFVSDVTGTAKIFDLNTATQVYEFPSRGRRLYSPSKDGRYIAYNAQVFDRDTNKDLMNDRTAWQFQAFLGFYKNEAIVSLGYGDDKILWRSLNKRSQHTWPMKEPLTAASIVADRFLVAATSSGRIYRLGLRHHSDRTLFKGSGPVNSIEAHPVQDIFAAARGSTLDIYSVDTMKRLLSLESKDYTDTVFGTHASGIGSIRTQTQRYTIRSFQFSGDNLAWGDNRGLVELWNFRTKSRLGRHFLEKDMITSLGFNPVSHNLLVGTKKGHLVLLSTGEPKVTSPGK